MKTFEKTKNENFEQPHSAEKCKRDPLGFFNIHPVAKYQKMEGGPFGDIEKCLKAGKSGGESLIEPKN